MKAVFAHLIGSAAIVMAWPAVAQTSMPLPKCFRSEAEREAFQKALEDRIKQLQHEQNEARDRSTKNELELEWRGLDHEWSEIYYVPKCPPPPLSPNAERLRNMPFGEDGPMEPPMTPEPPMPPQPGHWPGHPYPTPN